MGEPVKAPEGLLDDEARRVLAVLERAVARICPPALAASRDDLVQAAHLRLLEIDARGEHPAPRSPSYLWQVAYTAVVDELRRLRRKALPLLDEEPRAAQESPELRRDLRACLDGLLAARRSAVVLHLQGFGAGEIATMLSLKAKSAQNLIYRGLADLRGCLSAKGHSA